MRVVKLRDIDLTSSNVAASTATDWSTLTGNTTVGTTIKVTTESDGTTALTPVIEYEALAETQSYPPDNPTEWSEIGATNRWEMFDGFLNTYTESAADTEIDVTIEAGGTDTVGIFGIQAEEVTFQLIRASTVIKEETFVIVEPLGYSSWYYWLFREYEQPQTSIIWSYPLYADSQVRIVLEPINNYAQCTQVGIGRAATLGSTEYGVTLGIDDYSIKDTDSLGRTYLNQGVYAKRADLSMWLENGDTDMVIRKLTAVRGEAAIYDGNNEDTSDCDALRIYGYFQSFDVIVPGPSISKCNIEIRGLT